MKRYWPLLFLPLIAIIPLWRCVFLGEAIGPFDQIRQMAPWNGPKPAQPWDVLQADGVEVDPQVARNGTPRSGLVSSAVAVEDPVPPQFFVRDPDGNRFRIVEAG